MNKKKQQGFTLVEIVVVLSIGAIVLSMVGSMIVFSMNMFASGVGEVQDSISISELQDLLKTELESATEIVITQDSDQLPQGKWNSFAITDANGLIQTVAQNDHSSNTISFKDFGSLKDDITLKVQLLNDNGKYAKVTIADDISYVVSLINAQYDKTNRDIEIKDDMILYYKKEPRKVAIVDNGSNNGGGSTEPVEPPDTGDSEDEMPAEPTPDPDFGNTGTIVDQIATISPESNRGKLEEITKRYFYQYDAIFIDGYWWVLVADDSNHYELDRLPPQKGAMKWKKLNDEWDKYSAYEKGDIVKFQGKYYQAQKDIINVGLHGGEGTNYYPLAGNEYWNPGYWEEIDTLPADGASNIALRQTKNVNAKKTVINKILKYTNDELLTVRQYNDKYLDQIPICKNPKNPTLEDIWMVKEKNSQTGAIYFSYYIRINNYGVRPNEKSSTGKLDWQRLSVDFSDYSVYFENDIVLYADYGRIEFMKCKQYYDVYFNRKGNAPFEWVDGDRTGVDRWIQYRF